MAKTTVEQQREEMANRFYNFAVERQIASKDGHAFHKGAPFHVLDTRGIKGLRVCIVKLDVGFEGKRLLGLLDDATLPHLIPWTCTASRPPIAYPDGKFVVIEAPWPVGLERNDIQLRDVRSQNSLSGDIMVIGQNQAGVTIALQSHSVKHILTGGQTGSGKTVLIRSLAAQVSQPCKRSSDNLVVLVDGKDGTGLGILNGLRGQVGPLAIDMDGAIGALGWAVTEMKDRARIKRDNDGVADGLDWPHIYVFFDEFQTWTLDAKNIVTALLHTLLAQGREVGVHVVGGTQKPLVASFGKGAVGSASAGQLDTRIGLSLEKPEESRIMMGASSRAKCHRLFGNGDSYVKARDPHLLERVQIAYINEADLQRMAGGQPGLDEWPEFNISLIERETAKVGRRAKATSAEEYAIGIEAVIKRWGRPEYRKQFEKGKVPGADRARNTILPMCREIVKIMMGRGMMLE